MFLEKLNLNPISNIKAYLKECKKNSFKYWLKSTGIAILAALVSTYLSYLCFKIGLPHKNALITTFSILSTTAFAIIAMFSSIATIISLIQTVGILFNFCDKDVFETNLHDRKYFPIFSSETQIKQLLNLLATTALYVPEFKEFLKDKGSLKKIKECLKYNCALLNTQSFENFPPELRNNFNSNIDFIQPFFAQCFFHINKRHLHLNKEFRQLLNQSLESREQHAKELEKEVFEKMNSINLDENPKENQTLEEAKKTLSLSL